LDRVEKGAVRRHFRRLRRESLPQASLGLRQRALAELPALLPAGLRLGLYWPVGHEPDLEPLAAAGLADQLPGRLALPGVLPGELPGELPSERPDLLPGERPADAGPSSGPARKAGGDGPGRAAARTSATGVAPSEASRPPERLVYLPWDGEPPSGLDACGIPAPLPSPGESPAGLAPEQLGLLLVPALAIDPDGIRLGSGGGWYDRLRADPAWRAVPALAVLPAACVVDRLPRDPWDVPFSGWLDERGVTWVSEPG
jgi:5-formyltetrahydrofolate cyclo-ligase